MIAPKILVLLIAGIIAFSATRRKFWSRFSIAVVLLAAGLMM